MTFFKNATFANEITLRKQSIVGGTLADLANTKATTINGSASNASGNIVDIASLPYKEGGVPLVYDCLAVTGDIVDFVKARRKAGRTSDNITHTFWAIKSGVTFNGKPIVGSESILSWTANTITFNGETINA